MRGGAETDAEVATEGITSAIESDITRKIVIEIATGDTPIDHTTDTEVTTGLRATGAPCAPGPDPRIA